MAAPNRRCVQWKEAGPALSSFISDNRLGSGHTWSKWALLGLEEQVVPTQPLSTTLLSYCVRTYQPAL